VPVQKGIGNDSYTDLMLLSGKIAIGIEAKYTEPKYETINKWLGDPPSDNRLKVLEGWFDLLERATGKFLNKDEYLEITYQLIHRSASVCYPDARERFLIYQCFNINDRMQQYYSDQLSNLISLLGHPDNLHFYLIVIPIQKSNEYMELESMWNSGQRKLEKQVKAGLIDGNLMKFQEPEIIKFN
jgi:hypothetical protein